MSHRRRGVGVGKRKPAKLGGDSRDTSPPPASAIADRLNTDAIEHARSVVEQLKRDLNAFAESHKDDISDDPAFRSKVRWELRGGGDEEALADIPSYSSFKCVLCWRSIPSRRTRRFWDGRLGWATITTSLLLRCRNVVLRGEVGMEV